MTTTLSRDEQIILTVAESVSDDEKILVYDNGATYWIDKKDLYEPFAKEREHEDLR